MESTFEDHLKNLDQAIQAKYEKVSQLQTNLVDYSQDKESLKTNKLDLENAINELQAKINSMKSQMEEINSKLTEIEGKELSQENKLEKECDQLNQKISTEIEKAVQTGKKYKRALLVCANKIDELDSKMENQTSEAEPSQELEEAKQQALIEIAFGINKSAGDLIGKELKTCHEKKQSLPESETVQYVKIKENKFVGVDYKNKKVLVNQVEASEEPKQLNTISIDSETKLVINSDNYFTEIKLEQGGKVIDDASIDFFNFGAIKKSKLEQNLFYLEGTRAECKFRAN